MHCTEEHSCWSIILMPNRMKDLLYALRVIIEVLDPDLITYLCSTPLLQPDSPRIGLGQVCPSACEEMILELKHYF
ncbi:unnamed protein product [Moneuplotes crassus]|uniref:Uncharacterized protein n=1 Tax=Euplotes crassus TaxID=5936 RepID=A0AAD1XKS5_EUPCR|nr:unnamed protein product [Moneuplotes crassus]